MAERKKQILIVDDEADFVRSISHRLSFEGFDVVSASSAEEAQAVMERKVPDLVLLDIMMPGISGVEMFEDMRRNNRFKSTPVIFLTVWDQLVPEEFMAGAHPARLVTKPFDFKALLTAIREALAEGDAQADSEG